MKVPVGKVYLGPAVQLGRRAGWRGSVNRDSLSDSCGHRKLLRATATGRALVARLWEPGRGYEYDEGGGGCPTMRARVTNASSSDPCAPKAGYP